MSGHFSHASAGTGHERDLSFNRVLLLIPISMILLIAYVAVCRFGASSSLKKEMARKAQSIETGVNSGMTP